MVELAASTLRFTDLARQWRLPVYAADDTPVALIQRPLAGRGFTATGRDGALLCRARRRHPLSRAVYLSDSTGRRFGLFGPAARGRQDIEFGSRRLHLSPRWFGQGWVVTDDAGVEVLWSVRTAAAGRTRWELETGHLPAGSRTIFGHRYQVETYHRVRADDWLVTPDPSLSLAQVVAIVESYRLHLRAQRNQRSGGG